MYSQVSLGFEETNMVRYDFTTNFKNAMSRKFDDSFSDWDEEQKLPNTDIYAPIDAIIKLEEKKWILIEYEIHRADPSNNVSKISYWLNSAGKEYEVIVIQLFTPHYNHARGGFKAKRKLSEYIGEKLIKQLHSQHYHAISSMIMNKESFEKFYREYDKNPTPKMDKTMNMLVEDYFAQIMQRIT